MTVLEMHVNKNTTKKHRQREIFKNINAQHEQNFRKDRAGKGGRNMPKTSMSQQ